MQIAFTTGGDLWVMDTVLRDPKLVHGATRTHERDCVFTPDGTALTISPTRRRCRAMARGTRGPPLVGEHDLPQDRADA